MIKPKFKLAKTPELRHPGNPKCGGCLVQVENDGDGWVCPSCGSGWNSAALEAEEGEGDLYEVWAGEEIDGPLVPLDRLFSLSLMDPHERDKVIKMLTVQQNTAGGVYGQ